MQERFSREKEGQLWQQREQLQFTTALLIWVTKCPHQGSEENTFIASKSAGIGDFLQVKRCRMKKRKNTFKPMGLCIRAEINSALNAFPRVDVILRHVMFKPS